MKLIQSSSGKQILKISKQEWETIGRQQGWMKESKDKNWIQDAVSEKDEGKFGKWCKRNGFENGVCQSCIDKAISKGGHPAKMANFAINVSKGKYHHPDKD